MVPALIKPRVVLREHAILESAPDSSKEGLKVLGVVHLQQHFTLHNKRQLYFYLVAMLTIHLSLARPVRKQENL